MPVLDGQGNEVYVVPITGCFFNDIQVCLATKKKSQKVKVNAMVPRFQQFWYDVKRSQESSLVQLGGRKGLVLPGGN
jgi:hypothetical protein